MSLAHSRNRSDSRFVLPLLDWHPVRPNSAETRSSSSRTSAGRRLALRHHLPFGVADLVAELSGLSVQSLPGLAEAVAETLRKARALGLVE